MPYVNERWLGGMLTNFQTVHKRLQRLKELEEIDFDDVAGSGMTKKELLRMRREKDKLEKHPRRHPRHGEAAERACGSSTPTRSTSRSPRPGSSASRCVAILDTNCDPDDVDYPIPGNDDAIRAVHLLTRVVADAVADGLSPAGRACRRRRHRPAAAEPLAEWEQELLAGSSEPAADTAAEAPAPAPADAPAEAPAEGAPAAVEAADTATPAPDEDAAAEPAPATESADEPTAASTPDAETAESAEPMDSADAPRA